ncbi:MAG: hypothetical protein LKM39_05480 [Chiayiivirga sp.]|nr:hypothetical protein [Chiayiivirga sp.]
MEKQGKKNVFSGRILEIEGLPDLKIEQAFELADASAERSSAGCTVQASTRRRSSSTSTRNVALLKWMIAQGYSRIRVRSPSHPGHGGLAGQSAAAAGRTPMPSMPR